jgi:Abnormal spindle-like microcephaly-assoc'd, ASPM-SPD-2-Hydin
VEGTHLLTKAQWQPRKHVICYFVLLLLALLGFIAPQLPAQAQTLPPILTWWYNTPDYNAILGLTTMRLGCSSTPDFCMTEMLQVASSQDIQRIYLSIRMDPATSANYAAQFSQWSLAHPVLYDVGFDDLVDRMWHLQNDFGIAQPGTVVTDTINAAKSANPNLKFSATMYEEQLGSPFLADSNLPPSTRANFDYIHLYIHYRQDGPNYASYVQQTKAIFPNAKIIAGAYAYDRIDYLPCSPGGIPCTAQQEQDLFQQLLLIQVNELKQGIVDQIEFFPGYFGLEAQWPYWSEARRCQPTRLPACIANTIAMRQNALQDLTSTFGPPGPLTSLSPRPLEFPVQSVATTSGASAVTLNNPGTAPLNISSIAIAGGNSSEFSQQNSCPATLAPNSNCSINIKFTPAAVGIRASQLVITDNARRSPHTMDLSGTGASSSSPQVLLSATALGFQDQTLGTKSAPLALLVTNVGQGTLSISSITIKGTPTPQFAQTNNCGSTVAAAGSCTIDVTFTPTTADNQAAQLIITDNAPGSPHTIPLTGIGAEPAAAQVLLSKTVLTFDSQTVNTSSVSQSVTLSNPGPTAVVITQVTLAGTNAADFSETNTCGSSLAAAKSCTLSVTFKPSGVGPRTSFLLVADNANGSPQTITVNGTGAANTNPVANLSPATLTFPSQTVKTTSATLPVTLTNTGSAALALTSIAISGAEAAEFAQTNTCGNSVAAGATCTVNVTFTPAATGSRSAQLQINDNAAGSPQIVAIIGTAIAISSPVVTLAPASLNFGNQSVGVASPTLAVTLDNTGNSALSISSIAISGANAADFAETSNCTGSVAAGASCSISVVFTPAQLSSRSGQIVITDNASGSPHQIALSGSGTSANTPNFAVSAAPPSATVTSGQSTAFTLSVAGSGGFSQSVQFACSGLPAGASCSFSPATVTPGASSAATTALTIATVPRSGRVFHLPKPLLPSFYQTALSIFAICLLLYFYKSKDTMQIQGRTHIAPGFIAIILLMAGILTGCGLTAGSGPSSGSGSGSGSGGGGTPAGTYMVSVTASSQTLTHQVNLSLTVK